ncbi:MAG: sigma-70 family RNA polymerase sigma factor [Pseudonocardiaceae bacterium]
MNTQPPDSSPAECDSDTIMADDTAAFRREHLFASGSDLDADQYPRLWNASTGIFYRAVVRPETPAPLEYVSLPIPQGRRLALETMVAIAQWNGLWEAAQYRRRMAPSDPMPAAMYAIADRGDHNVAFIPRTASRYHEYTPLYHLTPQRVLEQHALPLLRCGQWPYLAAGADIDDFVPADLEVRLSRAWAAVVWAHLMPRSSLGAFTSDDPVRILAHDLDSWVPAVTSVMQEILRGFPLVASDVQPFRPRLEDGTILRDAVSGPPRMGGDLWRGEDEAAKVVAWTVDEADRDGHLRAVLDAVRSNRVHDDFSAKWSRDREDFDRKLNHKRARVSVRFVELPESTPVQSPMAEVEDNMVFANFLALLNKRDRQVVVLLRKGVTNLGDVASLLGYANHSAVSKRLARIRRAAATYFDGRD